MAVSRTRAKWPRLPERLAEPLTTEAELVKTIREAGREPVQRDTCNPPGKMGQARPQPSLRRRKSVCGAGRESGEAVKIGR